MKDEKVLLGSLDSIIDVMDSKPAKTQPKKEEKIELGTVNVQPPAKNNVTPQKPAKPVGTSSSSSAPAPMKYTPMTGTGGKATYGLNFESSKNSNDFINTNSPFASYRITSKTGARDTGVSGASRNHAGIDRAVAEGTAVKLPMDVTFHAAGYDNARGNWIEVKDSNGYILHYQHLKDYGTYSKGQVITAGSTIARSGSSGVGSGAHLHEEYYAPNGKNVTESYWAKYASGAGKISGGETSGNSSGKNKADLKSSQDFWSKPEEERIQSYKDNGYLKENKLSISKNNPFGIMQDVSAKTAIASFTRMFWDFNNWYRMTFPSVFDAQEQAAGHLDRLYKTVNPESPYGTGNYYSKKYKKDIEKSDAMVKRWKDSAQAKLDESIASIDSTAGKLSAKFLSNVEGMAIDMIPTIVVTYLTKGKNLLGKAGEADKAAGYVKRVLDWGKNLMGNGAFWTSYILYSGDAYGTALEEGATEEQATYFAQITGFANAAIEHSGGAEKLLADDLGKAVTKKTFWKKLQEAWGKNAIGEMFEEGGQDIVSNLAAKLIYKKDASWFSVKDDEAVINPIRTGMAMGAGYFFGGIFGTGNAATSSITNAFRNAARPERQEIKAKFARLEERIKNGDFDGMTMEEIQSDPEVREFTDFVKRKSDESGRFSVGDTHTPQMQKIIREYNDAVDNELVDFVDYALSHPKNNKAVYTVSEVSERAVRDIKEITGIDVEGFSHSIKAGTVRHIEARHGANGKHNQSMKDVKDVARMGYVLENYDTVRKTDRVSNEYKLKDNTPAPIIEYTKRVNGTYYVIEAVTDAKKKELGIITAYKITAEQPVLNTNSLKPYVRNEPSDAVNLKMPFPVTGSKAEGMTLKKVDDGVVSSASFEEGLAHKHQLSDGILTQNGENVKKKITPLNRAQRRFFSSFGVDVEVREDLPLGVNGKIMTRSGKLLVSPYATVKGWKLTRHEFTHYLRTHFNKAYNAYADAVRLEMGDKWQERYDAVRKKYEAFAERYPDEDIAVDADTITEEVVAEYAEGFNNSGFMERIAKRDLSVGVAIRNAFRNIIQKVKAVFTHKELKANRDSIQRLLTAKDMWEQAVIKAAKSPKTVLKNAVGGKRYSIADKYTYQELINKPDMTISKVPDEVPLDKYSRPERKAVIDAALKNVKSKGNKKNTADASFVYVKDIGKSVLVGANGIRHGLTRNSSVNAMVSTVIGDILENAIRVNELIPRDNTKGGHVLLGVGADSKGNYYPTRIIVSENEVTNFEVLGVVYAINAKKKSQSPNGAEISAKAVPLIKGSSTISIAELLDIVKDYFPDVLPQDVLDTVGIQRTKSVLSDQVKYSYSDTDIKNDQEAESRHDWEEDMWGDGKVMQEIKSGREDRWKQAKADGHDYFWFLQSEMGIVEHIVDDFERQSDGVVPPTTHLRNDLRQLKYELRLAEKSRDFHKAENIMLKADQKILKGIFADITSEHLKSMPIRQLADRYKKLTGSHMTAKDIASRLESIYSTISHHMHGSSDGGVSGYGEMLKLVRDMYESRKLAGDDGEVSDARMQIIADNMVQEIFKHKASAEGKQGVIEAFAKAYGLKYSELISSYKAYINRLEADAKTTKEERVNAARKEVFEKEANREFEEESIYAETEIVGLEDIVKGLKVDGVRFVEKRLKENPGIEDDKVYIKFEHYTPSEMAANPEYKAIIKAIKDHVNRRDKELKKGSVSGEYGKHRLFRYCINDLWRGFELFFKDNYKIMKKLVLDPLDDAKMKYMYMNRFYLTILKKITDGGIKAGSDLSKATQYYVEYVRSGNEKTNPPTEEGYIKAAEIYHALSAEEKEKVKKAGDLFVWMQDGILESVNHARRAIYPYAEKEAEMLEAEKNEIIETLKLMEIAFSEGDMRGVLDYNVRQSKLDAIRARQESKEKLILRKRVIVAEKLQYYDEKIKETEIELANTKDTTQKYTNLKKKLARFITERDKYRELGKIDEAKIADEIQQLQKKYENSGKNFVDKVNYDTEKLEQRLKEIEERLNDDLGYARIIKPRKDYFHHMAEQIGGYAKLQGWFSDYINNGHQRNGGAFSGDSDKNGAIDLRIAEIRGQTKPKASWVGAFQHRNDAMDSIECDAVLSFLAYLPQASYAATIDPYISILRRLAKDLREEGHAEGNNSSNYVAAFAKWLDRNANQLAGKTNEIGDSWISEGIGRDVLVALKKLASMIRAAKVTFNVSTMFAQVGNLWTVGSIGTPGSIWNGALDAVQSFDEDSEISKEIERSQFLNERFFNDFVYADFIKAKSEKSRKVKYAKEWLCNWMLSCFDNATTRYIWGVAYERAIELGEEDPVRYADEETRRCVGGRGIGEMAYMQNSEVIKTLIPFSSEAFNGLIRYKDKIRQITKKENVLSAMSQIMAMFFATWIQEKVFKAITGNEMGLLNPIGVLEDAIKEKKELPKVVGELAGNALGSLPGSEYITVFYPAEGIGALPSTSEMFGDEDFTKYGNGGLMREPVKVLGKSIQVALKSGSVKEFVTEGTFLELLGEIASGMAPGGSQARKTIKGAAALKRGEVRKSNGDLKFEVERTPGNIAKGLLFGENAFKEADEYYNSVSSDGIKLKNADVEGFKYNKKSRTLTIGEGVLAKEVELTGDNLKKFEEDRLAEYNKLYNGAKSGRVVVQNPYAGKTGKENIKKRDAENRSFGNLLEQLVVQGTITVAEKNRLYSKYKRGEKLTLKGVQYATKKTVKVKKKFNKLTRLQQMAYRKELKKLRENGTLTQKEYMRQLLHVNAGGEVYVKEYITGSYSSLTDEEKELIHSGMNAKATQTAKGRLKVD